jgi:tetratricopeptide (TPR) repeat protein
VTSDTSDERGWWRTFLVGCAGLLLLAAIAFAPIVRSGWIWDDDSYVVENPVLRDSDGLAAIWRPGGTPQFYPVVFTSFWIEARIHGPDFADDPLPFHLVNWALHVASAILLWRLLVRLRVPGSSSAAWLAAALFAVHPMQVESVSWVTERKNVLSLVFALASLHCWLRWLDARSTASDRDALGARSDAAMPAVGWLVLALAAFVLGMLSKTTIAFVAPTLVAIELWRRAAWSAAVAGAIALFFVVGVPLGLLTVWIESTHVSGVGSGLALEPLDRLVLAPRVVLFYAWTWIWPTNLAFIYERWTIDGTQLVQWLPFLACLAVAAAAIAVLLRSGRRGPVLLLVVHLAVLFPALGFFDVYPFRFSFVADHFAYASAATMAIATAWCVDRLAERGGVLLARTIGAGLLVVCVPLTAVQTTAYRDEETLWRRTLAVVPNAWMPASNLSAILLERAARSAEAGRNDAALAAAAEAESLAATAIAELERGGPADEFSAWLHRAEALRLLGRPAEAIAAIDAAIVRAPEQPELVWSRGRSLEAIGRVGEATDALLQAALMPERIRADTVRGDPALVERRRARQADAVRLALATGRGVDAIPVLELMRGEADARGDRRSRNEALAQIGAVHATNGDPARAREAFEAALAPPAEPALLVRVLPLFVDVLLAPPVDHDRAGDALAAATWLVEASGRADPMAHLLRARALAALERRDEARTSFAEAERLVRSPTPGSPLATDAALSARLERELELRRAEILGPGESPR